MPQPLDSKAESLRQQGALNPHPHKVADPNGIKAAKRKGRRDLRWPGPPGTMVFFSDTMAPEAPRCIDGFLASSAR